MPTSKTDVALFQPLECKSMVLKNRIIVSSMCQYSSANGYASDYHLMHVGSFASHGPSLLVMEAAAVTPEGRISTRDLGIYKDEHVVELKRIVSSVKLVSNMKLGI